MGLRVEYVFSKAEAPDSIPGSQNKTEQNFSKLKITENELTKDKGWGHTSVAEHPSSMLTVFSLRHCKAKQKIKYSL